MAKGMSVEEARKKEAEAAEYLAQCAKRVDEALAEKKRAADAWMAATRAKIEAEVRQQMKGAE